jgi:hypothetical protein
MRFLAMMWVLPLLRAQEPLPPDLAALAQIRARMLYNLAHQPNYTCIETIERSSRTKSTKKYRISDTLRLEVALVDGKEMFGWPGSKKFEDSDVTKMVTTGTIGTGDFGTHARALFSGHSATFHYLGTVEFQGKPAIRFDYHVPQMLSGYSVRMGEAGAIVGYHGSFYANPQTFDMLRIEVVAEEIPVELMLSRTQDKIDYAMTRIGDGDFLLPSQSELSMFDLIGNESHNNMKFTSCRQFSGESTITFADPAEDKSAEPVPIREFDVPGGLEVSFELTEKIDLRHSAIGDPVHTRVQRDVKLNGTVILPKGAIATGRITRTDKFETYVVIGMEFPEVSGPGILGRMKGTLDHTVGIDPVRGRYSVRGRAPRQPGEGVFVVNPAQLQISKGCIMVWRTENK